MTQINFAVRGSGAPVLLLHAFPLNAKMWEPQMAAFQDQTMLVAPDYPGFGASGEAASFESLDALAERISEGLQARGIQRMTAVGCSMGGYLAFALLRSAPRLLCALVLINSKADADAPHAKAARTALAERVSREGCGFLAHEWPTSALSSHTLESKAGTVAYVRSLIAQATPQGVIDAQRSMAARPDSRELLALAKIPCMVIHGKDDRLVREDEARAMAATCNHPAEFVTVARAGHLPSMEQPDAVNAALRKFVQRFVP